MSPDKPPNDLRSADRAGERAATVPDDAHASNRKPAIQTSADALRTTIGSGSGSRPDLECPPREEWAHLRLIEEIGRGGFGRVYRAWDATLAREVALKLVVLPEGEDVTAPAVLEEGRMLARVRHPNVVTVYGALQIGREVGLWMELVRGSSLAQVVTAHGPFGAEEASVVGLSVCRALSAVHRAGLVHRDVKAQNVMRESGGRIVLMDFGAGWDPGRPIADQPWRAAGTPSYMAPEVIAGGHPSAASDIYAVGVLLYFLVTGTHPYDAASILDLATLHAAGRRRLLADLRPDVPERFIGVVERALAAEPHDRYPSAGAMLQDLAESLPHQGTARREGGVARRVPAIEPHARPRRRQSSAARLPAPAPLAPQIEPPRRPGVSARAARTAAAIGAVILLIGVLGFAMSMAFNVTLGRPLAFAAESPVTWWIWGVRSIVAPVAYMGMALLLVLLVRWIVRTARRASRHVDAAFGRLAAGGRRVATRLGITSTSAGQALLAIQALGLVAVLWRFRGLIAAFTSEINSDARTVLLPLAPEHVTEHVAYGIALDLLILGSAAGWIAIVRARRRHGARVADLSVLSGVAVLAASVLLLELPYRTIWQNEFPRVNLVSARCYVIGERATDWLLHCPELTPPRNRVVARTDPALERLGKVESIFTPR